MNLWLIGISSFSLYMTAALSGASLVFLAIISACFFRAVARNKSPAVTNIASVRYVTISLKS